LLYAAQKALGPKNLKDAEVREIARRVYSSDPSIPLKELASAIGISRNRVLEHISDLRAAYESAKDVKVLRLHLLGMPQDRTSNRLGIPQQTLADHLPKMHSGANPVNGNGASAKPNFI